ncbi:hypothetical protein TIFTF001_025035 [Ficus carica]|uniref:C2H2-type domain-containing protein n=1 Tax=Ficus carica TaxID=3494 RepID=A0AA88AMA7_FICCA|nr:hypothetical protein TIFTF001_025035 [Ficus carica]
MSHNSNFSMATNSAQSSSPSVAVAAAATAEPAATWVSLKLVAIPAPPQPKRAYTCTICAKPFPTPQALGGHRNGHRKELNDMLMRYVQRRLEAARNIAATAALDGEIEHPPRRNRAKKNSGGGGGRGRGRANRKTVETVAPSLELSLAIGGKSKRKNYIAYKYPEEH